MLVIGKDWSLLFWDLWLFVLIGHSLRFVLHTSIHTYTFCLSVSLYIQTSIPQHICCCVYAPPGENSSMLVTSHKAWRITTRVLQHSQISSHIVAPHWPQSPLPRLTLCWGKHLPKTWQHWMKNWEQLESLQVASQATKSPFIEGPFPRTICISLISK